MPFPALWGQNLQNSIAQKTTYNMSKFTCSLDRIIFQNVITGAVFVVNTLCNWILIILTTPTLHENAAKYKPYNASVLTLWYILFKYFKECTVHNNLNLLKLIQRKSVCVIVIIHCHCHYSYFVTLVVKSSLFIFPRQFIPLKKLI